MDSLTRNRENNNLCNFQDGAGSEDHDVTQIIVTGVRKGSVFVIIAISALLSASLSVVQNLQIFMETPEHLDSHLLSISLLSQIICSALFPWFLIRKRTINIVAVSMTGLTIYAILNYVIYQKDYHFTKAGMIEGSFSALLGITVFAHLTSVSFKLFVYDENQKKENIYKYLAVYFALLQTAGILGSIVRTIVPHIGVTYQHSNNSNITLDSSTNTNNDVTIFGFGVVAILWAVGAVTVWFVLYVPYCWPDSRTMGTIEDDGEHFPESGKSQYFNMLRQYLKIHSILRMCSSFFLGLQEAYFATVFTLMFRSAHPESSPQYGRIDVIFVSFTVFSALGSVLCYLSPKCLKSKIMFYFAFLMSFMVTAGALFVDYFESSTQIPIIIYFVTTILWGLSDGILKLQIAGYYAMKFKNMEEAFARHYLGISLGLLVGNVTLDVEVQLVLLLVFLPAIWSYHSSYRGSSNNGSAIDGNRTFSFQYLNSQFNEGNCNTLSRNRSSGSLPRCLNSSDRTQYE